MEVRFYHLLHKPVQDALPGLLAKALETGKTILVKTPDAQMAERLNDHLWTYTPNSFLPHGTEKDGHPDKQPIFITHTDDNPSNAKVLILTFGAKHEEMKNFDLCCDMFDGHNEDAVQNARQTWKALKEDESLTLTYWQQTENGWEKKA